MLFAGQAITTHFGRVDTMATMWLCARVWHTSRALPPIPSATSCIRSVRAWDSGCKAGLPPLSFAGRVKESGRNERTSAQLRTCSTYVPWYQGSWPWVRVVRRRTRTRCRPKGAHRFLLEMGTLAHTADCQSATPCHAFLHACILKYLQGYRVVERTCASPSPRGRRARIPALRDHV